MKEDKLAINNGPKIRNKPFPAYKVIDDREIKAVEKVLKSGILSKFLGCWDPAFYGGPQVQALEKKWAKYFKVKHAIAVNSCTSGLYCAVGASGIGPGDEVIVTPLSMSASATSILIFNAVPVFADIDKHYFCLDPKAVEKKITKRTKAIVVVDIYGQPYDVQKINALARKHKLYVIEDCAQAIGATYKNKFAGTLGDIGIYSLNFHKHIHTGEGGMVVTNNDQLAEKVRLIRNHAEAVVGDKGVGDLVNMIGFNFRMTEIEAAIASCQLSKLKHLLTKRVNYCDYVARKLALLPGITAPAVRKGCTHSYYVQCFKYNEKIVGVPRHKFIEAVKAELTATKGREKEGVRIVGQGGKPLYLEPLYQKMIAYGSRGCPFRCPWYKGKLNYKKGLCPVAEKINDEELFQLDLIHASLSKKDVEDIVRAFQKVYRLKKKIR